jgi:aspartate aminotransferase
MSSRVSDLLGGLAPSATLAVDAKAKALKAAGEPVIGYGAGEPDFPTPVHIVEAAAKACYDPVNYKYTPTAGLQELREAIAAKSMRDSGLVVTPSQILVTNGGKHAVATSFMTTLNPGDEVLIPAPYWTTYPEAVYLAGATPVPVMTSEEHGFRVTVDELEKARTTKTKMLVFVSPSNPSGAVVHPDDVAAIGRWAAEHDIWVLCDEIYEHLTYGQTTSNISNISQRAAIAALNGDLSAVHDMRVAFDRRRKTMTSMLNAIDGVRCAEPEGAFYCFPNVTGLLGRSIGGHVSTTSADLATLLLETIKIAVVPGEAFGTPGFFRLSYALSDQDLVEGLDRLSALVAAG